MDDAQLITEIEQRRQSFYRIVGLCQTKEEIKSLNETLEKLTAYFIQISDEKLMQKYENDLDERQHQIEALEQQKKKMQAANKYMQNNEKEEKEEIQKLQQKIINGRRIKTLKDVVALLSSQQMFLSGQQDKLKDVVKEKKKELQTDSNKTNRLLEEDISKVTNQRENEMKEISKKTFKNNQLIQEEIQKIKKAEKSLKELYIQKKKRLLSQKFKQQDRSENNSDYFQQGEIRQIKQQSDKQSGKIKIPFDGKQIRKQIQGKLILLVGLTILLIGYNLIC